MNLNFLTLLYPPRCPICDRVRTADERPICPDCRRKLRPIGSCYCLICGKAADASSSICSDCRKQKHFYHASRAVYQYVQPLSGSLYRFKQGNRREYASVFAQEMMRLAPFIEDTRAQALIPVPVTRRRYRERGYNQSLELAKELSELCHIPIDADVLIKCKDTSSQKQLDRQARRQNLADVFFVSAIPYQRVLLIDDIYTTGATADECALVLKQAGAKTVDVLCLCNGRS